MNTPTPNTSTTNPTLKNTYDGYRYRLGCISGGFGAGGELCEKATKNPGAGARGRNV